MQSIAAHLFVGRPGSQWEDGTSLPVMVGAVSEHTRKPRGRVERHNAWGVGLGQESVVVEVRPTMADLFAELAPMLEAWPRSDSLSKSGGVRPVPCNGPSLLALAARARAASPRAGASDFSASSWAFSSSLARSSLGPFRRWDRLLPVRSMGDGRFGSGNGSLKVIEAKKVKRQHISVFDMVGMSCWMSSPSVSQQPRAA